MDDDVGQVVAAEIVAVEGAVERKGEEKERPIAAGGRAGGSPGVLAEDPLQSSGVEMEDVRNEELVVVYGGGRRRVAEGGGGHQRHAERRQPGNPSQCDVQDVARG